MPITSLGYPTSIYVYLYWLPTYLAPAPTNHPTFWINHPPCVRSGPHQPRRKTSNQGPGLAGRRNDHLVSPRFSKEVWGNSTADHGEQWLGTVNVWQWLTNLNTEWLIMCGSYIVFLSPALVILYQYNVHCKRKAGNRIKAAKLPRLLKDRLRSLSWLYTQALGFTHRSMARAVKLWQVSVGQHLVRDWLQNTSRDLLPAVPHEKANIFRMSSMWNK